jgi:riboflavin synthase
MFTGLIESLGRIRSRRVIDHGERLEIETGLSSQLAIGDSLATSGVCLTVTAIDGDAVAVDVSPETLRVTALGRLAVGSVVNLERPLRADGRLGGHFVQGHVDATGTIAGIVPEGDFRRVRVAYPESLARYLIVKGSIALDGISLTVASLAPGSFDVQIIPHTWSATTLSSSVVGDLVNLECDLIGKYVVRLAELRQDLP